MESSHCSIRDPQLQPKPQSDRRRTCSSRGLRGCHGQAPGHKSPGWPFGPTACPLWRPRSLSADSERGFFPHPEASCRLPVRGACFRPELREDLHQCDNRYRKPPRKRCLDGALPRRSGSGCQFRPRRRGGPFLRSLWMTFQLGRRRS